MAEDIKVVAKITTDASQTKQELENTQSDFNKTGDAAKKAAGTTDESLKKLNKTQENTAKASKETSKGFGAIGNALKGLGVLAAIDGIFNIFKDTLGKNQKVADFFTTSMNFLSKAFNDLFSFIEKNIQPAIKALKDLFENPKQAVLDLGNAIKNNLIERFNSAIKVAGFLGTALKELLTGNLDKAGQAAKAAGKEMLDVVTGINNTGDKIAEAGSKIADYTKETWKAAAAQTALKNNAKLAESQLQGLVEEYDRQAEVQRQIRDDETKSIEERTAANNKLGDVLQKQQKAMLQLADVRVNSAAADMAANKGNIDFQTAYNKTLNDRKGIIAQVTGLQSEQKVNAVALAKEQFERDKAIAESNNKIYFERKKAAAEAITDELAKAQTLKRINEEEAIDELQRLSDNINNTKAGTQARVDAEIAYNEKKKDIDIAADASDIAIKNIQAQREKDLLAAKGQNNIDFINLKKTLAENEITDAITKNNKLLAIAQQEHDAKKALLLTQQEAEVAAAEKAGTDTTAIKAKYNTQLLANDEAYAQSQRQLSNAIIDAKVAEVETVGGLVKGLSTLINQESAAGKATAVALATVDTFVAAWRAFKNAQANPISILGPAYPYIAAASAAAAGIANIRKIVAVQMPGSGAGGSVPSAAAITAPVTPTQTSTRLDSGSIQAVGNAAQGGVGRTYVLDSDIKNNNEVQQRLIRAARLS